MIVVPDASVVLKWVLEESRERDFLKALELQRAFVTGAIEVRVPTLWRYEVGNILGLKRPDLASELMKALLDYDFEEVRPSREHCLAVLNLMREVKGVTFYDSCYHALALQMEGVYVTADSKYVKMADRKGHLVLLSDWRVPGRR